MKLSKSYIVGYVKGKILGLKRSKAKVLTRFVRDFKFKYYLVQDLVYDLLKFKLNKIDLSADTNCSTFKSYLIIDFKHKYMDILQIPQLLNNQDLVACFPIKETYPKISFRYSQTLGSMAFNYAKFAKEIVTEDLEQYSCECHNSIFKDEFHNHIVTGNLDILEDNELIDIFKYGSKFRIISA